MASPDSAVAMATATRSSPIAAADFQFTPWTKRRRGG